MNLIVLEVKVIAKHRCRTERSIIFFFFHLRRSCGSEIHVLWFSILLQSISLLLGPGKYCFCVYREIENRGRSIAFPCGHFPIGNTVQPAAAAAARSLTCTYNREEMRTRLGYSILAVVTEKLDRSKRADRERKINNQSIDSFSLFGF